MSLYRWICCSETIFIIIILCVVAITLPISIIYKTICNKNYFNRQCRVVVFISANIFLWLCYCRCRWRCHSPCCRIFSFHWNRKTFTMLCTPYATKMKIKNEKVRRKLFSTTHCTRIRNPWSLFINTFLDFDKLTCTLFSRLWNK